VVYSFPSDFRVKYSCACVCSDQEEFSQQARAMTQSVHLASLIEITLVGPQSCCAPRGSRPLGIFGWSYRAQEEPRSILMTPVAYRPG